MSEHRFRLTKNLVIFLYGYYGLLIISGLSILFYVIFAKKYDDASIFLILFTSLCSGSIGSSSCYVRKLYKDGMNDKYKVEDFITIYSIHTFIYYLFRPIFAAISSFFIVIGIHQGFFLLSNVNNINNPNFFYLCNFISFLIGFNVARMFGIFNKENIVM